jgi:hypothetical protein
MMAAMRKGWIALGVAAALASLSCKRPLGQGSDAGDSGILPIPDDAGQGEPPRADAPPGDAPIDVHVDVRGDAPLDSGPGDGGTCAFDSTTYYGYVGGRVRWRDTVVLSPPDSYMHIRSPVLTMPADMQCAPRIPACNGPALDVADVNAALADFDVQQAFRAASSTGPPPSLLYGVDSRPVDGQVFSIERTGGIGFLVGGPCPPGSNTSCREIPGGISRLVATLMAFDQQQLGDPSCAFTAP